MGYKIVIDAMGGDYAPQAPVGGALMALEMNPELSIVLTGTKEALEKELAGKTYDKNRLSFVYTTEVVENEEHSPVEAIRRKKDSSMVVALKMVKNKEVDGFVSAGNTGAVLSGATLLVGRIKGVQRPALTVALPSGEIPVLVLDIGANMDSKPSYLVQYAKMCEIYCRKLYGIAKPSIGLLNVGVEPGKGNALSKEVYELLMAEKEQGMNFIGNVEAREVFSGDMNIVVTDAFAGNVLLKNTEGVVDFIFKALKKAMYSNLRSKIGALLLKPALMELKSQLDPRAVGGTPLLGVDGAVIKAHGNSNDVAISSAVKQCLSFIKTEVNEEIRANLKKEPKEA